MPICLSIQNHSRWQTFIAHSKRIWLVIQAIILNFVAETLYSGTILTFLMRKMLVFTLFFHFIEVIFETLMFDELLVFFIVNSANSFFLIGTLNHFNFFFYFLFLFDSFDDSTIAIGGNILLLLLWSLDNSSITILEHLWLLISFFFFLFYWF